MNDEKELLDNDNRAKFEFRDKDISVYKTPKGLDENTVREISKIKGEPEWMLEFRLKSLKEFFKHPTPSFGPDLSFIDFQDYTYYTRISDKVADN
jgi:Fe-S cluster assembly protein SufB